MPRYEFVEGSSAKFNTTAAVPEPEVLAAAEPGIAWTPELRALVLPRRDGDVRPAPSVADPVAAWAHLRQVFGKHAEAWKSSRSLEDPDLAPVLRGVLRKLESEGGLPPVTDPEIEGALLVVLSLDDTWSGVSFDDEIVTLWAETAGLPLAVEALQRSLEFETVSQHSQREAWLVRKRLGGAVASVRASGYRHWFHLRRRLTAAGETEWAAARDTAERLRAGATVEWRVLLAYLFPETGWAEEDAREVTTGLMSGLLVPVLRDAGLVSRMITFGGFGAPSPPGDQAEKTRRVLLTLLDNLGTSAVAPLFEMYDRLQSAGARQEFLDVLGIVGTAETAEGLVQRHETREATLALAAFAARFPRVTLPALAARAGRGEPVITSLLSRVVHRDRRLATELLPGLPETSRRAVEARLVEDLPPDAPPEDLPPALASPPLQRKGKLPKRPDLWQPAIFARPLLRGRAAALPPAAVEGLGTILSISRLDEPNAGLEQVREACDPASLAAFAWDLFSAWLTAGAPSKEQWAFHALGHLGDDACARRLAPFVRQWPGEAAHARAVAGLDVLRAIGTDVALMHLHGISQKLKFKGLQDKAREKIAEVAEQRGLTPEDLADRLVPDLGLDADGTLVLDFGPRGFRVGFDETLKPFVRDDAGKRLPDLPKPGKADDAERAGEAVEIWKTLKKDAKALAGHQILRLELAMCGRRRWEPDVFRTFFLEHPLLQHLVRRLAWGAWEGSTLTATFRVSEDGSLADAEDEAWVLPEAVRVGIVHRLDLSDEQAARWGEVFADYQILQPFAQLGRELYPMTEEERGARELKRIEGLTVPTGKVLGLVDQRGWRRGPAQDNGCIWWFAKPLPEDCEARLALETGVIVGMVAEFPEQELGTVTLEPRDSGATQGGRTFGSLDAVTFSELVRDLEGLR
jgi:Domain of unknown function (DUF4132)